MSKRPQTERPRCQNVPKLNDNVSKEIFTSAAEIVNNILLEQTESTPTTPIPVIPKPDNLARVANRYRQKLRPSEPTDLKFDLDENFIPQNFYRGS